MNFNSMFVCSIFFFMCYFKEILSFCNNICYYNFNDLKRFLLILRLKILNVLDKILEV